MYQPPGGPPHYGHQYRGYAPQPQSTDSRATTSLILGVVSVTCMGFLTGIPAVILGFSAKRTIDQSGGMIGGSGTAIGGIITGLLGTLWSVISVGFVVLAVVMAPATPPPAPYTLPPATAPIATATVGHGPHAIGSVSVVDLEQTGGALREQLQKASTRARVEHRTLIVQTTATWCSVCREVDGALGDPKMQSALGGVSLVRVDVDTFDIELKALNLHEGSVPWFYKLDSALHASDAISAGEWDDNTPTNMAPVLKAFVGGTLKRRRAPSPIGTAL